MTDVVSYERHDPAAIRHLFASVFTDAEGRTEGELIGRLVHDLVATTPPQDLYGYCAVEGERRVGSIFFSRLRYATDATIFLLSPVAVRSADQGRGIGQKMIAYGLQQLAADGVDVVLTYGDPAFYGKVGFQPVTEDAFPPPFDLSQPEGWIAQSLTGNAIESVTGLCTCVPAFDNPALW